MDDRILDPARWPAMPGVHRTFLEGAVATLRADSRLLGLTAGGSMVTGGLDEHSDLDLIVVAPPDVAARLIRTGTDFAAALGPLLTAFSGEHVGEPRLMVCLYGPPLLHVDIKFVSPDEFQDRVEDPLILWDRDGTVTDIVARTEARFPGPRLQWIEDRFWGWVHYIAGKIQRGELFETLDGLGFLRARVLGPLLLSQTDAQPSGVRRIEERRPDSVDALRATLASHDRESCWSALLATVDQYRRLREQLAAGDLVRREAAEQTVMDFVHSARSGSGSAPESPS